MDNSSDTQQQQFNQRKNDLFTMEMDSGGGSDRHKKQADETGFRLSRLGVCILVLAAICGIIAAGLIGNRLSSDSIGSSSGKPCPEIGADGAEQQSEQAGASKRIAVRLSSSPYPLHYQLNIQPFLESDQLTFNGKVVVLLWNEHPTKQILLNSLSLDIQSVGVAEVSDTDLNWFLNSSDTLTPDHNSPIDPYVRLDQLRPKLYLQIDKPHVDNQAETLEIKVHPWLRAKTAYLLNIAFTGNITNILSGFYRSTYVDSKTGNTVYFGMTQFQATDARRAFPCWDEPAFKSTFDITIVHASNHVALCNMPTQNTTLVSFNNTDWIESRFKRTLRMSTYLLAWAVGELQSLSSTKDRFAIWSRPSVVSSAEHALRMGPQILNFYQDFFKIAYPLPKTDMLASPDFNAGAMENWGLVTFRETLLLYEPKHGRLLDLYTVSSVVAHELAHQWFGNLVTMRWWDDLWLNEGFATYMSYEALHALRPDWEVWHDMQVSELQLVLRSDCLRSSHPISVPVGHPDEISEIFDQISYSKGASIIRMMVHLIGRDKFRAGVSAYLHARAYANAQQDDLWKYLTQAADGELQLPAQLIVPAVPSSKQYLHGERLSSTEMLLNAEVKRSLNVKQVMDSWTLKQGYPVVHVERDYTSGSVRLWQQRFRLKTEKQSNENDLKEAELWEVPITYTTKSEANWEPTTRLWLHKTNKENDSASKYTIEKFARPGEWALVNLQQVGFYRVNYDDRNWDLLIQQLSTNHSAIHAQSRSQLVNDLFALAEAGLVSYNRSLDALINYLPKEDSPLVWRTALIALDQISAQLQRSSLFMHWTEYMRTLLIPLYKRLNFESIGESKLQESELQAVGLHTACRFHIGDCVQKANTMFQNYMQHVLLANSLNASATDLRIGRLSKVDEIENPIPPNVRSLVYCMGVAQGEQREWEFVWKAYRQTQIPVERNRLLHSLKCTRVPWLLVRLLDSAFHENSGVKKQDGISLFRSVASQDHGRDVAFSYLRQHWSKIVAHYGKSFFSFGRLVASISGVNTEFELKQMLDFHRSVREQLGSAKRAFQQAIENIEFNLKWMELYYPQVQQYLTSKFNDTDDFVLFD